MSARDDVCHDDDGDDDQENDGRKRPERGLDLRLTALCRVEYISADRIERRGLGVCRDEIVVEGEREGEHEAGYDARNELGKHDFPERLRGRRSEVKGGFVETVVHLCQLGFYRQEDEGRTEHDLTDHQRNEGVLIDAEQNDEKDAHRKGGDDVGVDDGNLVGAVNERLGKALGIVRADRAEGAEDRGDAGNDDREHEGPDDHVAQFFVGEEVDVILKGEP